MKLQEKRKPGMMDEKLKREVRVRFEGKRVMWAE